MWDSSATGSPAGRHRKTGKSVIASTSPEANNNDMPTQSSKPATPSQDQTKLRTGRRLIAAAVLIGLAIGGLALVDRFRDRPAAPMPSHEPSQALITPPAQDSDVPAVKTETAALPPPPPQVVNNEKLASPAHATSVTPTPPPVTEAAPAAKTALVPGKAYLI